VVIDRPRGGGGGVGWIAVQDPLGPPLKRVCGPDVTDLVVENLSTILGWGPGIDFFYYVPGGLMDFKGKVDAKGNYVPHFDSAEGCPSACPHSLTLCAFCVNDGVPGNIAFGASVSQATAEGYGSLTNDSGEDITSYEIGRSIAPQIMRPSNLVAVRDRLCRLVARHIGLKGAAKGSRLDPGLDWYPCERCGMKAKPRPSKPREPDDTRGYGARGA
jgi:hypothetical protein